jgi:hypothetical protein
MTIDNHVQAIAGPNEKTSTRGSLKRTGVWAPWSDAARLATTAIVAVAKLSDGSTD